MSTYLVVAPCAYPKNGRLVRHRRPGAEIELDEATAAKLGAAVTLKDATAQPAAAPEHAEPAPTPPPAPGADSAPTDTEQETSSDGNT